MMKRFLLGALVTLGIAVAAAPAQAVSVPGCFANEYLVFAKNNILFENQSVGSHTVLFGNIIVSSPTGKVKVGNNNEIHGTLIANEITLNTGAVVDKCIANVLLGPGTCLDVTQVGPGQFTPPAACDFPPLQVPVVDPCVNTAPNITVTGTTSLPAGCFKKLTIAKNAVVTLDAGGTYNVQSLAITGSAILQGADPNNRSIINSQSIISTGTGSVTLRNLFATTLNTSGSAFHIYNDSLVDNSILFAPLGMMHPHTGTAFSGDTELVADRFEIQRVTNTPPPPGDVPCICPVNTSQIPGTSNLICRPN